MLSQSPLPASRQPAVKLIASPAFALMHAADGAGYVMQDSEPYAQYWLSERERLLFAVCGRKGGMSERAAIDAVQTLSPGRDPAQQRQRIAADIAGMRAAGVLLDAGGELSRYGADMASAYLEHRPFPTAIAAQIIASGAITRESRVLDLASGPGSLALQLAATCRQVTIMELSRGFCAAAQAEAAARGLVLHTINESCNRLPNHDGLYEVITISQALHWLDQAAICRGVGRTLAPGGSFFVIDAAISLPAGHPLSYILGDRTPLGDKSPLSFADQAAAQFARLDHLFKGLGTGIAGADLRLFRQARPISEGFARAFLSDRHIGGLGQDRSAFWQDLAARCTSATAQEQIGNLEWAVLHFRHGGTADAMPLRFEDIAFP